MLTVLGRSAGAKAVPTPHWIWVGLPAVQFEGVPRQYETMAAYLAQPFVVFSAGVLVLWARVVALRAWVVALEAGVVAFWAVAEEIKATRVTKRTMGDFMLGK